MSIHDPSMRVDFHEATPSGEPFVALSFEVKNANESAITRDAKALRKFAADIVAAADRLDSTVTECGCNICEVCTPDQRATMRNWEGHEFKPRAAKRISKSVTADLPRERERTPDCTCVGYPLGIHRSDCAAAPEASE